MNNTQLPAVIDQATGEVAIPETEIIQKNSFVASVLSPLYGEDHMPLHLAMLYRLGLDAESLEVLMSLYHMEATPFAKVANMDLLVHGMLIVEHDAGQYNPNGYFQVVFLAEKKDGTMVLVKSGGHALLEVVSAIILHRGGGLFKEPIEYHFSVGDDKKHRIYNTSLDMKRLRRKSNV